MELGNLANRCCVLAPDAGIGMEVAFEYPLLAENIGTLMMMLIMVLIDSLWSWAIARAANVQINIFRISDAE